MEGVINSYNSISSLYSREMRSLNLSRFGRIATEARCNKPLIPLSALVSVGMRSASRVPVWELDGPRTDSLSWVTLLVKDGTFSRYILRCQAWCRRYTVYNIAGILWSPQTLRCVDLSHACFAERESCVLMSRTAFNDFRNIRYLADHTASSMSTSKSG